MDLGPCPHQAGSRSLGRAGTFDRSFRHACHRSFSPGSGRGEALGVVPPFVLSLSKDRSFFSQRKERKEQGFDKRSPNGSAGSIASQSLSYTPEICLILMDETQRIPHRPPPLVIPALRLAG
jgi:hypothetical protein